MSVMPYSAAANTDSGVQQSAPAPTDAMTGDAPIDEQSECGSMRISASELHYVGGDHWVAILDGIADLKEHVEREEQLRMAESPSQTEDNSRDSDLPTRDGAFLLYGRYRPESRDAILAALPPRYAVDRYISRYFNYLDLVSSGQCLSIHILLMDNLHKTEIQPLSMGPFSCARQAFNLPWKIPVLKICSTRPSGQTLRPCP